MNVALHTDWFHDWRSNSSIVNVPLSMSVSTIHTIYTVESEKSFISIE